MVSPEGAIMTEGEEVDVATALRHSDLEHPAWALGRDWVWGLLGHTRRAWAMA